MTELNLIFDFFFFFTGAVKEFTYLLNHFRREQFKNNQTIDGNRLDSIES